MKNNTKKIVVLDRLNSSRIEQAIFILRDEDYISESDAVSEAEKIVQNYLTSGSSLTDCGKKKRFKPSFFFAMLGYTVLTVALTMLLTSFSGF